MSQYLYGGAGSYLVSPTNLLTTEMDNLPFSAGNVLAVSSGSFDNTIGYLYGDIQFDPAVGFTPTAAGYVQIWFLRSLDGGVTFEDGSAGTAPGRRPDVTIAVPVGTTQPSGQAGFMLPPGTYKVALRNRTGVAIPAGSILRIAEFSEVGPDPGPVVVESTDGTIINSTSGVILDGVGATWTLAVGVSVVQPPGNTPPAAAAVGYNTLTFGPDMTLAADSSAIGTKNWARFNFIGIDPSAITVTENLDGSLTMSTGNMGNIWGGQLCSAAYNPSGAPYMKGHAFGGGAYFEAVFSFTGPKVSTGCSFWANDIESMAYGSASDVTARAWPGQTQPYGNWLEIDMPEFNDTGADKYGVGMHNWYGPGWPGPTYDVRTGDNPAFISPITTPTVPDWSQPHKFGYLWVPATGSATQTNVFGNPTLAGGSTTPSPGILPTGMDATTQSGGLQFQVVATRPTGIDLRMHGIANGSGDCNIYLSGMNGTAVQPSTGYMLAVDLAIIAGSTQYLAGIAIDSNNLNSGHGWIGGATYATITPTGVVQTFQSALYTTTSVTAYGTFAITLAGPTNGQNVDITLRIENPKFLQTSTGGGAQGYCQWFFDDVQVGSTSYWDKWSASMVPPPIDGTTAYSVIDTRHFALILGLGDSATPMTIYSVSVWQKDATNNVVL